MLQLVPVRIADPLVVFAGHSPFIAAVAAVAVFPGVSGPVHDLGQVGDEAAKDYLRFYPVRFAQLDKLLWQINDDALGHGVVSSGWLQPRKAFWTCQPTSAARRAVKASERSGEPDGLGLDGSSTVLRCPHVQEDFFHGANMIEGWQGLGEAEDSAVFALAGADQALTHGRAGNLKPALAGARSGVRQSRTCAAHLTAVERSGVAAGHLHIM